MDAILAINAGSSSVKFAVFDADSLSPVLSGQADGIGVDARLTVGSAAVSVDAADDHETLLRRILTEIVAPDVGQCVAVGHRVVHGGVRFHQPAIVTDAVLAGIEALTPLARSHQPHNAAGIRVARAVWPETPQIACFDTAFHATLPRRRQVFALPLELEADGVRRYGFHGLSYEGIAHDLPDLIGPAGSGRVIAAHLGNGASLCAMKDGVSQWTSMGFTPLDGLVMGRRPGNLDPGILVWLMRDKGLDADALDDILNRQSGLLGLSGVSPDLRDILADDTDRARLAVDVFVDRLVMETGAAATALGGVDALVFSGGIGENAAVIRSQTVTTLDWLGFALDETANANGDTRIEADGSKPVVIIRAREEAVIARAARAVLTG